MAETEYNGVKIPAYCAPTRIEGENTINDGLVIIDENGNEWVWIEVPKSIYTNTTYNGGTAPTGSGDSGKIESVMKAYARDYRDEDNYKDTWYSEAQHGFKDADEYNNYKNNMLKSVYENGGFYIGRYEVGTQTARFAETDDLTTPIIKQDAYPYNYVTCKQAQTLSNQLATEGNTTSLMFGIQWDLIMKFIEEKGKLSNGKKITKDMLNSNSGDWGNYKNISFDIIRGQYTTYDLSISMFNPWTVVESTYTKPASIVLLTTGATNRNSTLNIYDLAGSLWEWTLESYANINRPCGRRGGDCSGFAKNNSVSASSYNNSSTTSSGILFGFRPSLY